jgi:ABC-type transport system substrate-binding protein
MKARNFLLGFLLATAATGAFAGGGAQSAGSGTAAGTGKKTVTIANNGGLTSFDGFAGQTGMTDAIVRDLWGDTLMATDHSGNITPWLAESIAPSADYLSYTVKLRKGVMFTDGAEMTSNDAKISFERVENPTSNMLTAFTWGDFLAGDPIEIIDNYTFVIHFDKIMVNFYNLASQFVIINGKAYQADPAGYFRKPIGSGPFSVVSMDPTTSRAVFARNDNWWGWSQPGIAKSNVDEIIFQAIPEDTTRISALRSGEIDISSNIPMDTAQTLRNEGLNVDVFTTQEVVQLGLKVGNNGAFADQNLREALSLCINRQLLVDSILGGGNVANWPVVEASPVLNSGNKRYAYDVARAKQLVAASAYRGGALSLVAANGSQLRNSEICQAIQSMAAEAGINIRVEVLENAAYTDRRNSGSYDILFTSTVQSDGQYNVNLVEFCGNDLFKTGWHSDQLSAITGQWARTPDMTQRATLATQGFNIIMDNFAPYIYLYWVPGAVASGKTVSNFKAYSDYAFDLRYVQKN